MMTSILMITIKFLSFRPCPSLTFPPRPSTHQRAQLQYRLIIIILLIHNHHHHHQIFEYLDIWISGNQPKDWADEGRDKCGYRHRPNHRHCQRHWFWISMRLQVIKPSPSPSQLPLASQSSLPSLLPSPPTIIAKSFGFFCACDIFRKMLKYWQLWYFQEKSEIAKLLCEDWQGDECEKRDWQCSLHRNGEQLHRDVDDDNEGDDEDDEDDDEDNDDKNDD